MWVPFLLFSNYNLWQNCKILNIDLISKRLLTIIKDKKQYKYR